MQNGCDTSPLNRKPKNNVKYEQYLSAVKSGKKIIGFVGNLESKINIPLLEELIEKFSDCLIVLIGSTHSNPHVFKLSKHENVLMPGIVLYDEVGAWVSHFSVGILPHYDTELTKNMNPLKAYVYLSYNLPVVSTKINNIPKNIDGFYMANDNGEFIALIDKVLKKNKKYNHDTFVKSNSWESRFSKQFDNVVKNVISLQKG